MATESLMLEVVSRRLDTIEILAGLSRDNAHSLLVALSTGDVRTITLLGLNQVIDFGRLLVLQNEHLYGPHGFSIEVIEVAVNHVRQARGIYNDVASAYPPSFDSTGSSVRNSLASTISSEPANPSFNADSPHSSLSSRGSSASQGIIGPYNCTVCSREFSRTSDTAACRAAALREKEKHQQIWTRTTWFTKDVASIAESCKLAFEPPGQPKDLLFALLSAVRSDWTSLPFYVRQVVVTLFLNELDLREVAESHNIRFSDLVLSEADINKPWNGATAGRAKDCRAMIMHCLHHHRFHYDLVDAPIASSSQRKAKRDSVAGTLPTTGQSNTPNPGLHPMPPVPELDLTRIFSRSPRTNDPGFGSSPQSF